MDTLTQITLGAAIGEAALGKRAGYAAPIAGAVLGVVPDLDVLANPFLSEVQQLAVHRGITHSIFFSLVSAPLFGWILHHITKGKQAGRHVDWISWSFLSFSVIITHIIVDLCTGYGTQIFQPFSNYSASLNTIFIIDPFYTLPLMAGIITTLIFKKAGKPHGLANIIGLAVSSAYLLFGFGVKTHVNTVFEQNFEEKGLAVNRYMTTPAPFTEFLWVGYAESFAEDTVYAGLYSIFDDDREIDFKAVRKNSELLKPYSEQNPVERLLWFSHGYFSANRKGDELYVHDLRFGRSDLWLTDKEQPFVWSYRLNFNDDSTAVTGFNHIDPTFKTGDGMVKKLIERIFGSS